MQLTLGNCLKFHYLRQNQFKLLLYGNIAALTDNLFDRLCNSVIESVIIPQCLFNIMCLLDNNLKKSANCCEIDAI